MPIIFGRMIGLIAILAQTPPVLAGSDFASAAGSNYLPNRPFEITQLSHPESARKTESKHVGCLVQPGLSFDSLASQPLFAGFSDEIRPPKLQADFAREKGRNCPTGSNLESIIQVGCVLCENDSIENAVSYSVLTDMHFAPIAAVGVEVNRYLHLTSDNVDTRNSAKQTGARALVIGINKYPGITVDGVPNQKDISGAVFDAKAFSNVLTTQFGIAETSIHSLMDADASRQHIIDEFRGWLINGTGPGDRVFFYYAGHGAAVGVQDENHDGARLTSAIIPADAHGDLAQQPLAIQGMILGVEMAKLIDQLGDRKVTIVSDASGGGPVTRDDLRRAKVDQDDSHRDATRLLDIRPDAAEPSGPGWLAVWSATTIDQTSFDFPDRPGGVFTQSFVEGLRDKKAAVDDEGYVSAAALLNYIRVKAKAFCEGAGDSCKNGFTPQLMSPVEYLIAPLTDR